MKQWILVLLSFGLLATVSPAPFFKKSFPVHVPVYPIIQPHIHYEHVPVVHYERVPVVTYGFGGYGHGFGPGHGFGGHGHKFGPSYGYGSGHGIGPGIGFGHPGFGHHPW